MHPLRLATLLCVLAAAGPAAAEPQVGDPAAEDRRAGYAAFDVGDYDGAIAAFQRAYRLDADPRLLYNLGLAYRKKHELTGDRADLVRARDTFAHFLALARSDDPRFTADRGWLEKVQGLAARYKAEIEAELIAGSEESVDAPAAAAPPPPTRRWRTPALVLLASGAATGLAAAVTGGLALRDASRADELAADGDHSAANQRADRADDLALATDILLATTAVSVGVAAVLWWRGRPAAVAPAASSRAVGVVVRF